MILNRRNANKGKERRLFSKAVRTALYRSRNSIETSCSRRVSFLPRRIIARKSRHCRLVEKSLVRGNRCIRWGIYNSPLPPHFSPFPFLSKRAVERERTNRRQISFYSFSFPIHLFEQTKYSQNFNPRLLIFNSTSMFFSSSLYARYTRRLFF